MKKESSELASNRRAYHDYEILETFEAGIALQGTEVKSLRNHGILKGELWLIGTSIALYSFGNVHNHEEKRDRKLLLHKREILKIEKAIAEKGLTVIPLAFYMKEGKIKLKIGIAKGKKVHDKRQALLEREKSREMDRALKRYR
jgi:SsrA-binding protein